MSNVTRAFPNNLKDGQITMVLFFLYLIRTDSSSLRYCKHVHWTSHFLLGTRNTLPCLTGHLVTKCFFFFWSDKHDRVFWYLVKSVLFSVRYITCIQVTRNTGPCLTGQFVYLNLFRSRGSWLVILKLRSGENTSIPRKLYILSYILKFSLPHKFSFQKI